MPDSRVDIVSYLYGENGKSAASTKTSIKQTYNKSNTILSSKQDIKEVNLTDF